MPFLALAFLALSAGRSAARGQWGAVAVAVACVGGYLYYRKHRGLS